MDRSELVLATEKLSTKSAKIRALDALGVSRADIARFLDIRYQHVRNVLMAAKPSVPTGVDEAPAAFQHVIERAQVRPDGSVVIPPSIAAQVALSAGDTLIAVPEDGGLWVGTLTVSRARARALVRKFIPGHVNLVDELLAQRRREVENEECVHGG